MINWEPERREFTPEAAADWIGWARRIQAIAQTGLTYTEGPFDRGRYEELCAMAAEMLAACADGDAAEVAASLDLERGYPTPKVDVRGAVFQDDRILLVKEAADGLWTLPGGWADGGDTPATAVEREVREESGFETKAVRILGIFDRDHQGHPALQWYVYKIFFLCEITGGAARTSLETSAVQFFARDEIPPLSRGRVLEQQIDWAFEQRGSPNSPTEFD